MNSQNLEKSGSKVTRRRVLKLAAAGTPALLAMPNIMRPAYAQEKLAIYNGWGGTYDDQLAESFFTPFTDKTGIAVRSFVPQTAALLRQEVTSDVYQFDFADYNEVKATQAKNLGFLDPVDFNIVDKSKLSEFGLASAAKFDGIAFGSLSLNIVYNKRKFPNGGPRSWADFWDVGKFPGKRALMKGSAADRMMLAALLADGVAPESLYPVDLERAVRKLDQLKPHLTVVYDAAGQGMQMLRDDEVDMLPIWGGRAWQLVDEGIPLEIVWEQAFLSISSWIVAKGTPRRENAWRLIDFANDPERLAKFARLTYGGPMHPGAFQYMGEKEAERTPSWPDNWKKGIVQEVDWTSDNLDKILKRYDQWLIS